MIVSKDLLFTYISIICCLCLVTAPKEYCQSENFEAQCDRKQVVMMESAVYGRMRAGRCVTGSYGNVGCSVDVLPYMDAKCSGRTECRLYIADAELHSMRPCHRDLASYLEASYRCIEGRIEKKCMEKIIIQYMLDEGRERIWTGLEGVGDWN